MRSLKLLSLLGFFTFFAGLNGMEEGGRLYKSFIFDKKPVNSQQKDIKIVPKIPVGVFQELAKAGINTMAKTEKEVFAIPDKFMKAGGGSAKSVMNLIKSTGIKKDLKSYTYGDFKSDIMDDIIDERARSEALDFIASGPDGKEFKEIAKSDPYLHHTFIISGKKVILSLVDILKQFGDYPQNKIDVAAKMEAFNWKKHQLKYNKKFQEDLNHRLMKLTDLLWAELVDQKNNLNSIEQLLKFGADPNSTRLSNGKSMPMLNQILRALTSHGYPRSHIYIIELIKLLLKYNANPNLNDYDERTASEMVRSILINIDPLEYLLNYEVKDQATRQKIQTLKEIKKLFGEIKRYWW